jgi:hypothetical protein
VYDTAQGVYVLTSEMPVFASSLQYFNTTMIKDVVNNQTMTEYETEIIEGKKATVFEYSIPLLDENYMSMTLWIWNEKGVPLKACIDMTMEEMNMTMDFRFYNYSFADIPDSTFSVS